MDIRNADELRAACELDETLWVATAAPVDALNFDPVLLQSLDADKDKRVTTGEFKRSILWALNLLDTEGGKRAVSDASEELHAAYVSSEAVDADKVLTVLKAFANESVDLPLLRTRIKELEALPVSDEGVILPTASEDETQQSMLNDLMQVCGETPHPSGKPGVHKDALSAFKREADAWLAWQEACEEETKPLGDETAAALRLVDEISPVLDRFYLLCETAALDPGLADTFWPRTGDGKRCVGSRQKAFWLSYDTARSRRRIQKRFSISGHM